MALKIYNDEQINTTNRNDYTKLRVILIGTETISWVLLLHVEITPASLRAPLAGSANKILSIWFVPIDNTK